MRDDVRAAFEGGIPRRLPRGELWLGADVFAGLGVADDIGARLSLCADMGMDLVAVPVGEAQAQPCGRSFAAADIAAAAGGDLFVVAVVSGPFQRLVERLGLRPALAALGRGGPRPAAMLGDEAQGVGHLVEACLGQGVGAVVLADDLAYDRATFLSPADLRRLVCPLYRELVGLVHRGGAYAVLHSDGDITPIVPDIVSVGFNGLSCQEECLDLFSLKRAYGAGLTLLAGMSGKLLSAASLRARHRERFMETVKGLGGGGGLILSSSSGLHSPRMVRNARRLYRLADEALAAAGGPVRQG